MSFLFIQRIYFMLVYSISQISEEVSNFIEILVENGHNINNFHLIGHSLGKFVWEKRCFKNLKEIL